MCLVGFSSYKTPLRSLTVGMLQSTSGLRIAAPFKNNTGGGEMSVISLIAIMTAAGVAGGTVNLALSRPDKFEFKPWLWNMIAGIGVAFLMPLFIRVISSDLLAKITSSSSKLSLDGVLVFAGFCLLAAISAKALIRSLTEKVLREVSKAKREAGEAKEVAESTKQRRHPRFPLRLSPATMATLGRVSSEGNPSPKAANWRRVFSR